MTNPSLQPESAGCSGSVKSFWRGMVAFLFSLTVACSVEPAAAPVTTSTTLSHPSTTSLSAASSQATSTTSYKPPVTSTSIVDTTTTTEPYPGWWDPRGVQRAWGDTVQGLLTFRGSPTRSWYGRGPVPLIPKV